MNRILLKRKLRKLSILDIHTAQEIGLACSKGIYTFHTYKIDDPKYDIAVSVKLKDAPEWVYPSQTIPPCNEPCCIQMHGEFKGEAEKDTPYCEGAHDVDPFDDVDCPQSWDDLDTDDLDDALDE